MQYIQNLRKFKLPFYIYKLATKDSIIYTDQDYNNTTGIIIQGTLLILKIFTNQEIIPISILHDTDIINIVSNNLNIQNYYYKATALEDTYVINFVIKYSCIQYSVFSLFLIKSLNNTLRKQIIISEILLNKEAKTRILQLIKYLAGNFGYYKNNNITIYLKLNNKIFSQIIGTNQNSINKILNKIKSKIIIQTNNNKIIYMPNIVKGLY